MYVCIGWDWYYWICVILIKIVNLIICMYGSGLLYIIFIFRILNWLF